MSIYGLPRRVACYVTRPTEYGSELLVFEHRDDDPENPSGVQVPAGAMLPFEGIEDAASREVDEETGLIGLSFVAQLGGVEVALTEPGGPSMTTYVHLVAPTDDRTAWDHQVHGEGEDAGLVFECRWEPLPLAFELAATQGVYLDRLRMS